MGIDHPYWDIYSKLTDLRKSPPCAESKRVISQLSVDAGLDFKARLVVTALACLPWRNSAAIEEIFFLHLREKYSYSVLSPHILKILAGYSPLVEVAAGNGYNAWLLRQMGVPVLATDAFPVEEGRNWFFNTRFGLPTRSGRSWTTVEKGVAQDLKSCRDQALLLCWPPKNPMAAQCLSEYPGDRLILIADKSCCADAVFYRKLKREWILDRSEKTGSWDMCHSEVLEAYSRIPQVRAERG